jgi:hypothetical protein
MSDKKVIDLAARRAAKRPRRVHCLTILLDEPTPKPPKRERPTTMRQATPEEMNKLQESGWSVGVFHRPTDPKAPAKPGDGR